MPFHLYKAVTKQSKMLDGKSAALKNETDFWALSYEFISLSFADSNFSLPAFILQRGALNRRRLWYAFGCYSADFFVSAGDPSVLTHSTWSISTAMSAC